MTTSLEGKVALVTGAASGIGFSVVQALHELGANVVGADITAGVDLTMDVTCEADWERVLDGFASLDILVLSAGVSSAGSLTDTSFAEWRRVMSVNLDGAFLGIRSALKKMQTGGSIVLLGSASGVKPVANAGAYCSSKAGMQMLTKVAALEAKPKGVRVNCVSPAGVVTPMWKSMDFFREFASEDEAWNALGGIDPETSALHRMAFPGEIAEAVIFLCSPAAAGITGIDLPIDAGYTL